MGDGGGDKVGTAIKKQGDVAVAVLVGPDFLRGQGVHPFGDIQFQIDVNGGHFYGHAGVAGGVGVVGDLAADQGDAGKFGDGDTGFIRLGGRHLRRRVGGVV